MSPTNGGCIHVDDCVCFVQLSIRDSRVTELQIQLAEVRDERDGWKQAKGESDEAIRQIVALVPRDPEQEDIFIAVERTVEERDEAERIVEAVKRWIALPPDRRLFGDLHYLLRTTGRR